MFKHRNAHATFNAKGYGRLADYNAERARGIVHTTEYDAEMAVIQAAFNAEHNQPATPQKTATGGSFPVRVTATSKHSPDLAHRQARG